MIVEDSAELEQLRELIKLFPADFALDEVEEANRLARLRFDAMDNELIPSISIMTKQSPDFGVIEYIGLCQTLHKMIFKDIISINGEFRQSYHPGDGHVYFGGQKRQELRSRFTGSNPQNLIPDLQEAYTHLLDFNSDTPVDNALRFYQKFVFTHPFYDGNGRVARLFVNLYLLAYGKFIDWKNLQNKGDFLNKLNYYHDTGIEKHFRWWANVCYKYVYDISDEDEK